MQELGLSQAELARRAGVSQPSIFKLIHENKTGSRNLHRIARELRTTPAYLSGETDDPTSVAADLPAISSEEGDWLELLRDMAPANRKAMLTIARSLAARPAGETLHDRKNAYRGE